jgi:hypothetical protein
LRIEKDQYWFYSILFYTDLGYMDACEEFAQVEGGAYVQFVLNLTELPLKVPLSFCLPKACHSASDF